MLEIFKILTMFILSAVIAFSAFAQERNLAVAVKTVDANEYRVALVIGNSAYRSSPLKNPINDARAMSAKLKTLGFDVIERENLTQKQVGSALREFKSKLKPGAVALFFYAGHGLQVRGVNYLPTVDAEIDSEEDVPMQSINLNQILELLDESKTRMNLVFLDACRNNPYIRSFRSPPAGLSSVNAPSGTIISFSTRPGSVAADGDGTNGIYTEALLANMGKPIPIEQVLKNVVAGVKAASNGRQEPWMEGSIEGDFYFLPAAQLSKIRQDDERKAKQAETNQAAEDVLKKTAELPTTQLQTAQPIAFIVEASYWDAAKNSHNIKDFELYLARYPQGNFAELARNRIATLQREEDASKKIAAQSLRSIAKTGTSYTVGDSYQYQSLDLITKVVRKLPKETVTRVTSTEVSYDAGPMQTDLLGNFKVDPTGTRRYNQFQQIFIPEYKVGKTWTSHAFATYMPTNMVNVEYETKLSIVGRETITVPAGTFDTFKIIGYVNGMQAQVTIWVAPGQVNRFVAYEYRSTTFNFSRESFGFSRDGERIELISFTEQGNAHAAQSSNLYGYTLGDRYVTQHFEGYKQEAISKNEMVIGSFSNNTIESPDKSVTLKADGSPKSIRSADGSVMEWSDGYVDKPSLENLKVGYKQDVAWVYRFKRADDSGEESHRGSMEVVAIETVKVPAGQFEAYKIVLRTKFVGKRSGNPAENSRSSRQEEESSGSQTITNWYVPSIRAIVVSQVDISRAEKNDSTIMTGQPSVSITSYRDELISYQVAQTQSAQGE
jgi:hypothetical protein